MVITSSVWRNRQNDRLSTQRAMAAQLASDSSERKFDEEYSALESKDYDDSQNHNVEDAVIPHMYEPEVEIGEDIGYKIPVVHNNWDDVEGTLSNHNW